MKKIQKNLSQVVNRGSSGVRIWIGENNPHPVVVELIRRGRTLAKAPFKEAKANGVVSFRISDETIRSFDCLWKLLSTSYDCSKEFLRCEERDVFLEHNVAKSIGSVFRRSGWSSYVWRSDIVEYSSFASAISMAIIVYALYIHESFCEMNYSLALSQCADAYQLLALHQELKSSVRRRKEKASIKQRNSKGGKARSLKIQMDKKNAKTYWLRWQREPGLYVSQLAFATDMLEKFGVESGGGALTSIDTIRNKWIPEWRREIVK